MIKAILKIVASVCCLSVSCVATHSIATSQNSSLVSTEVVTVSNFPEGYEPLPMELEDPTSSEESSSEPSSEEPEESQEVSSEAEVKEIAKSKVVEDPEEVKEMEKEDGQKQPQGGDVSVPDTIPDTPSTSTGGSSSGGSYSDGWQTINGGTYYYSGGKPLTGWQAKSGFRYYFDSTGLLKSKVGIDVSKYQGSIDWAKVKAAGVDFAMIRVGYRGYGSGTIVIDEKFMTNIKNAKAAGLKVGVYFYTQAISEAEAREEANYAISKVKESGVSLDYPIAYDIEYAAATARTNNLTNAQRTAFCNAFASTVTSAGYKAQIYANKNWLETKLNTSQISYDIWLAHYTSSVTSYAGSYKVWQYSSTGSVSGISGNVDLNIGFY